MSKSTPLNQLRNSPNTQNNETKENQLVDDILSEIEKTDPQNNQMQQIQQMEQMPQNIPMQQLQQETPEIQQVHQEIPQNIGSQRQMPQNNQDELASDINQILDQKEKSLLDKVLDVIREPLIVAAICILISIPKLNNMIISYLPKKEFILNNSNIFVLLIKGLLSGGLFYGIKESL